MKSDRFSMVKPNGDTGGKRANALQKQKRMAERGGWYSVCGEGGDIESKKETVEIFIVKPKRKEG